MKTATQTWIAIDNAANEDIGSTILYLIPLLQHRKKIAQRIKAERSEVGEEVMEMVNKKIRKILEL